MARRPVTRELQHGLNDKIGLNNEGKRVWVWAVDMADRDLTLTDLMRRWDDFVPGYVDGQYFVTDVSANQLAAGTDFLMVTQEWSKIAYENPLEVPFRWTGMESGEIELPASFDADKMPLVTTAGEPILGLTYRQNIWKFTGTRNIPGIPTWIANYGRSVNSDTVRIGSVSIPPGQLQLQRVRVGDQDDSTKVANRTIIFRPLEIEIWWSTKGWQTDVLNMGFYELQKLVPQPTGDRMVDQNERNKPPKYVSVRVDSDVPVFLDKYGRRYRDSEGTVRTKLKPEEIIVLHFNMDEKLPYNMLIQ